MIKLKFKRKVWEDRIQNWWEKHTEKEKRRIILMFFIFYLSLTVSVLLQVIFSRTGNTNDEETHIIDPSLPEGQKIQDMNTKNSGHGN